MNQFLLKCKEMLKLNQVVRIVLGNQTADMDSCVGSILLAYLYSQTIPTVPIINFNKHQFQSHFDINEIFQHLIFIDEIKINDYEIVVYDHNDIYYKNAIGCVDHHEDKGLDYQFKIIEKVGSGTTLVGELLRKHNLISEEIAILIMRTILIDTFNFDQKQYETRWNMRDMDIYNYCHSISVTFNREKEYEKFQNLKYNIELNLQLDLIDLLLKDYKIFKNIGYAVINVGMLDLLSKWNEQILMEQLDCFITEQQLHQLIVLLVFQKENKIKRNILIVGKDQEKTYQSIKHLKINQIQSLQGTTLLEDQESIYSRKILEPLISKAYE